MWMLHSSADESHLPFVAILDRTLRISVKKSGKEYDIIVAVTHTKVNSIPEVNNSKVNSLRELCYGGVCRHTLNTLPRSIFHT